MIDKQVIYYCFGLKGERVLFVDRRWMDQVFAAAIPAGGIIPRALEQAAMCLNASEVWAVANRKPLLGNLTKSDQVDLIKLFDIYCWTTTFQTYHSEMGWLSENSNLFKVTVEHFVATLKNNVSDTWVPTWLLVQNSSGM